MNNISLNARILDQDMRSWGIDSTKQSHREFIDKKQSELINIKNGIYVPYHPDMPVLLPEAIDDAVEQVITNEIQYRLMNHEDRGLLVCHDQLVKNYTDIPPWTPFNFDKFTRSYQIIPELREMGVTKEELDPLLRFSFVFENCREELLNQYVVRQSIKYSYLRALVYFHACHHAKCVTCGKQSVRYNALNEVVETRTWNRLVCIDCGSVYEVKTAADDESVKKKVNNDRSGVAGGAALDRYYALLSSLPRKAKVYLVVVPITFEEYQEFRDVYVVEIDYVTPTLKSLSFKQGHVTKKTYKIYSKIYPKIVTSRKWFDMPIDDKDYTDFVKQVLTT